MKLHLGVVLALAVGLSSLARAQIAADTKGTADERADILIGQMTLEEKISLIGGAADSFSTHSIPRLGIASFHMSDGPQGVRNGPGEPPPHACAFPCGAALAATWDPNLAAAYGRAIALEDRARGSYYQLGPGVNICRIPVNGRNFEYFGEDPFLSGVVAVNWVKSAAEQGVIPTIKHFACNNQETNRTEVDAEVDERTIREIYLPAFERAVKEGGNIALMCSYNRVNGNWAAENDWLLNKVLKTDWGFAGPVMSDWGACHGTQDLATGLDLEMPNSHFLSENRVKQALAQGLLREVQIDQAVHRILRTEIAAGFMDRPQVFTNPQLDSPASCRVALNVARSAIVLLKNDHDTLPLDRKTIKSIVVCGPNAAPADAGDTPNNLGGGGSGAVTPFHYVSYLDGIIKAAGPAAVTYLPLHEEGDEMFDTLANARTTADGPSGLTLNVQVQGSDAPAIASSVQAGINLTWQRGHIPFGVPPGHSADFTWSGVLVVPADSDWEVRAQGWPDVKIGDRELAEVDGAIIHLQKDTPTPITVHYHAAANSGGRRRGEAAVLKFGIEPPALPDMSMVKNADAVVVCIGLNRNVEHEDSDRPFELPDAQQYLVTALTTANPRTIAINNSGAAVGMTGWMNDCGAILQAWYLGQEGGTAIGEVLFGDVNPSGRLISTFDKHFEDNPAFANYPGEQVEGKPFPVEHYSEGIFYGYRGYDKAGKDPLFPFGFGLSYTTFSLSNLKVDTSSTDVKVTLDVQNTGSRPGSDVVQVYVGETGSPVPRPLRELKGFQKVQLDSGQTRSIEIDLPRRAFAYWSTDKEDWVVDSGNSFTISASESERDIKLSQSVVIQ
jgi:beta-glucosidase